MNLTFQSKTYASCNDFLKLIYNNNEYTLSSFSEAFKEKNFDLDILLPQCTLIYRDKKISYEEYIAFRRDVANRLNFFNRYREELIPIEFHLAISDKAYYQAAKFLGKAEECLQTARYYFYQSTDILEYDCVLNWKSGYQGIYALRTMNFQTAIIWYNNCFDYIVQIAFLAFELYRNVKRYNDGLDFEEILKMCTYNTMKVLHENQPKNTELSNLWNLIEECRIARQDLNDWANYSKHKGGLGFVGLRPESPFQIYVGKPGEPMESRVSEFESIIIDIDDCVEKIISAHNALIKCLNNLMDFINFPGAKYSINDEGKLVIPDKKTYRKIVLSTSL